MIQLSLSAMFFNFFASSCRQSRLCHWRNVLIFLAILAGLVISELILTAAMTGYMPNRVTFLLWDNIDFLLIYFGEEPWDTFKFVFMDKPLFLIESRLENPSSAVWGLHYYSYTVVIHIAVALVLVQVIRLSQSIAATSRFVVVLGAGLLVLSSLYLYLASCCTTGASWLLHTWLLAIVFNPQTATEFIIELYGVVHKWLLWLQIMIAVSGAYLAVRGLKRKQPA